MIRLIIVWRSNAYKADPFHELFDVNIRMVEFSARGGDLDSVAGLVEFEFFRSTLTAAAPRKGSLQGGRLPFDYILRLKVLILQAMHSLAEERAEFLIKDRL